MHWSGHPRRRREVPLRTGVSREGLAEPKTGEEDLEERRLANICLRFWTSKVSSRRKCLTLVIILLLQLTFMRVRESLSLWQYELPHNGKRVIFLETIYARGGGFARSSRIATNAVSGVDMSFGQKRERRRSSSALNSNLDVCPYIAPWQSESSKPNCNVIHELGMRIGIELKHLDSGGLKDVWQPVDENGNPGSFVLKTTVYSKGFSESYLDKHRRDALVMDQATKSPHVLDIHAYCAFSNVVERAVGTLQHWIMDSRQEEVDPKSLLTLALAVAEGVEQSQLYYKGMPTVAHADIKSSQFLFTEREDRQVLKLNDFNRCRFLTSRKHPSICNFTIPNVHKGSRMRSPEEYSDHAGQNDKIDVFSTGSVFYHMITGEVPFQGESFEEAVEFIKSGEAPLVGEEVGTDPGTTAILEVMHKCRAYLESDRPSSSDVSNLLRRALEELQ
eukprot:scaffold4183_cov137-Cylindrotheca_fusiformis.AAC.12